MTRAVHGRSGSRALDLHESKSDVREGSGERVMFWSETSVETFDKACDRVDGKGSLGKTGWFC